MWMTTEIVDMNNKILCRRNSRRHSRQEKPFLVFSGSSGRSYNVRKVLAKIYALIC